MRRKRYAAVAMLAALLLAGCEQHEPAPDITRKPTPSPTASEATKLELPEGMPELGVAAEVAPTRGSKNLGMIDVPKKTIWVNLNCIGDGKVVINVGSAKLDIPCRAGHILPTRNEMSLELPKKIPLKVTAPDAVQWSLRVQL